MTKPRYAIYFVPDADSALSQFACAVLGYDTHTGTTCEPFASLRTTFSEWDRITSGPRRYGFHATLKAPFHLTSGATADGLIQEVRRVARRLPSVDLGPLAIEGLGSHIALRPKTSTASLRHLEAGLVTELDWMRAPLSDDDRVRRTPDSLTARQSQLLEKWGYPFCLDEFRFHLTLAGPFDGPVQKLALAALTQLYRDVRQQCVVSTVSVLEEPMPGAPFRLLETLPLGSPAAFGVLNSAFVLSHR